MFLPDTNCMVAAVCSWHVHHAAALSELDRRRRKSERMLLAAHAVVEAYAVLTRLPPPHRVSPADALQLLEVNFVEHAHVVALDATGYLDLLRRTAEEGIGGGRIYDAVIARCALTARGTTVLTFNAAHFSPFARQGLDVVVPGE